MMCAKWVAVETEYFNGWPNTSILQIAQIESQRKRTTCEIKRPPVLKKSGLIKC